MTKTATKTPATEQAYHYYASTVVAWATGDTRAKAIKAALDSSKGMFTMNEDGGIYVYSARVELPQTSSYAIVAYQPSGVPISDAKEGSYKLHKGTPVHMARVRD
jgi:hypothetical protein